MQVSPVELQAWAEETGNPYPASAAEKAAVMPAVISWKAEQLADARASRGDNALAAPLMVAGGVGLGLAGLAAFRHFKKQGLSDSAAAQQAKQIESETKAVARQSVASAPAKGPHRAVAAAERYVRARPEGFSGPRLRGDSDPTAAELEVRGGVSMGSKGAREQGQYKARTSAGFHDPALTALDTPEKREAYLAGIADAEGTGSDAYRIAQEAIAAMEVQTGPGVNPRSFLNGMSSQERYGTGTAEEAAARGQQLAQSRTKANRSAQADYRPRDTTPQKGALIRENGGGGDLRALLEASAAESPGDMGATMANLMRPGEVRKLIEGSFRGGKVVGVDPKLASVFYLDTDGNFVPYLGNAKIGSGDKPFYTGRKKDGSLIADSDLAWFPTDDLGYYEQTGLQHPALTLDEIAANASERRRQRFASEEDQSIKGMLEPLPSSGSKYEGSSVAEARAGVVPDDASGNWTLAHMDGEAIADAPLDPSSGRFNRGEERVPLDISGFQSEMEAPARFAGGRLRRALDDYKSSTGQSVPESVAITWATDLGRQHGVDAASVLRGAGFKNTRPAPRAMSRPRPQARALGGGNSADHLDRIYTSLGMHAGADAWELEGMVRSGDIRGAANALAPLLPALTQVNGRFLRNASQDEKLNIVAEGLTAGLKDLSIVLQKYPQMAEKFGIGKGAGGFGLDAFIKSYIRDWITVRSLQLDPSGQPTYQVPADALEIIAWEGSKAGRGTIDSLEDSIRGSRTGLDAALKIDRLVSAAQSTKEGDPNSNATSFAQTVFSMEDADLVSTQLAREAAGDVRLSFATRRPDDATKGFYDNNPSEQLIDARIDEQQVPGFSNATLAARLKGIDTRSPDASQRQRDVQAAQQWIASNSKRLERDREDLNRGIVLTDQGPRSVGRGLVITSGERGAFLAGNTQGVNTSYREELFNDQDITPLDRAQDHEREAVLNNQIDSSLKPTGAGVAGAAERAPLQSEADRTAAEYGSQKLYFKNLGPASRGAMPAGEAYGARQVLRRYLQERGQDQRVGQLLDQVLPDGGWKPEQGFGFEVGASEPVRGFGPRPAAPPVPSVLKLPGQHEPTRVVSPQGLVDGAVDSYQAWYRPAPSRLPGNESAVREFPLITGGFQHSDSLPVGSGRREGAIWDQPQVVRQHLPNNVALVPAMKVTGYPDRPDQIAFTTDWAPRPEGRQPLSREQIFQIVDTQPRAAVDPVVNTDTAARHREALEARAVNGGEGFRDDQRFRDAAGPQTLYDDGEISGYGRRGTSAWGQGEDGKPLVAQQPIASAPISRLPAAAQEQLNTLRARMEQPVPGYTDQEAQVARVGHYADYMDRLYAQGLTANARPARRGANKMADYVEPSPALIGIRVKGLRDRGII